MQDLIEENNITMKKRKHISDLNNTALATSDKKKIRCYNVSVSTSLPTSHSEFSCNWRNLKKKILKKPDQKRLSKSRSSKSSSETLKDATKKTYTENTTLSMKRDKEEIWFDGVDDILLESNSCREETSSKDDGHHKIMTRSVALDCEMVGVGFCGKESMLARVSLVNHYGHCLLDRYVRPMEDVVDYRTAVSGITAEQIHRAHKFTDVQKEVCSLLEGRVLVGHALKNDLKALFLSHPRSMIRDTSRYGPFKQLSNGKTPSLKTLAKQLLGVTIQDGQHNSVEDARTAMRLYTLVRKEWEAKRTKRNNNSRTSRARVIN